VLITAYHYDREFSMESRLSWHRAQQAASEYDVAVICARIDESQMCRATNPSEDLVLPVEVVHLPLNALERALMKTRITYYAGYRHWHRRVFELASRLHAQGPFALVHHVSFCGFREPSEGWQLDVPFVWGPVGGTPMFPTQFLGELDPMGVLRELGRNFLNGRQLRSNRRVQAAVNSAASVLAANRQVARELGNAFGTSPAVQLETGIAPMKFSPRPRRDPSVPLKILWPGRLRSWKALPLLLKALAMLPKEASYTLRVLGQGPCRRRWQRLAQRLGIAQCVEWVGWPTYSDQLPHYEWADAVAFTSLRDTSGTGLLEALAAGAPIIGVDHQGAADIMTDACAIRVPVTTAQATIEGFRDAVLRLSNDAELLERLSQGARERAQDFLWERQWAQTREIYRSVTDPACCTAASRSRTPVSASPVICRQAVHSSSLAPQKASC
jgi:glycosyltransferase involved in cell wall biosynthesis